MQQGASNRGHVSVQFIESQVFWPEIRKRIGWEPVSSAEFLVPFCWSKLVSEFSLMETKTLRIEH